jgi:hypothetical protein
LPLSLGGDCVVDFVRVDTAGAPVEYDPGTTVTLTIDDTTPVVATAVISDEHAVARVESTVADAIKAGLLWRCVVSLPGSPSTEIVVGNGKTVRKDK